MSKGLRIVEDQKQSKRFKSCVNREMRSMFVRDMIGLCKWALMSPLRFIRWVVVGVFTHLLWIVCPVMGVFCGGLLTYSTGVSQTIAYGIVWGGLLGFLCSLVIQCYLDGLRERAHATCVERYSGRKQADVNGVIADDSVEMYTP